MYTHTRGWIDATLTARVLRVRVAIILFLKQVTNCSKNGFLRVQVAIIVRIRLAGVRVRVQGPHLAGGNVNVQENYW